MLSLTPYMTEATTSQQAGPGIERLFGAGAHFAQVKSRRHPSMKNFVLGAKANLEIFDLKKTDEQLAAAKIDLSSLRRGHVGAEVVSRAALELFEKRFATWGLKPRTLFPVYGLAESTLAASLPEPDELATYDAVDRDVLAREARAVPTTDPQRAATFAALGRVVPKMNPFIISFSMKLIAGFTLFASAGALIARYLYIEFDDTPVRMLQLLSGR